MLDPVAELLNRFSDPAFGTNYAGDVVVNSIMKPKSKNSENIFDKFSSRQYGLVFSSTAISDLVQVDLYTASATMASLQLNPNSIFQATA